MFSELKFENIILNFGRTVNFENIILVVSMCAEAYQRRMSNGSCSLAADLFLNLEIQKFERDCSLF